MAIGISNNNELRPGPSPINYFVAYEVRNEKTRQRVIGDIVLCTSESRKQMGESIIRDMGLNVEDCTIVFTSLTVLDTFTANQLIYGCKNKLNNNN